MLACLGCTTGLCLAEQSAQAKPGVLSEQVLSERIQGERIQGEHGVQGEHGRRAGAELRVLAGDVRKLISLTDAEGSSQPIKRGLVDRVHGALSAIDILLRQADQEAARRAVSYVPLVRDALQLISNEQWADLNDLLTALTMQFPLTQPRFAEFPQALIQSSRDLHLQHCAACHNNPQTQLERPAYNLHDQAKATSDSEFFARMLTGVRGDRVTGIDNPFTDVELAGLIHFYQSTNDN